ncbi:MAG: TrkH family potassium uptake protein [Candidatus Thermoplasmatota archaeon]|nr:TrkH family potassium uptake protein [Candidatus Thermoplasmatota archaeon]MBS3790708.1 TrkH family potassium uptake protein [Candidatus Thermoplasmatota archaeon]
MTKNIVWTSLKETKAEISEKIHPYFEKYGIFSTTSYYLGVMITILGGLLLIPAGIAYFIDGSIVLTFCFVYPSFMSIILGLTMTLVSEKRELYLGAAIALAALTWLIVAILGAIPFYLTRIYFGPHWGLTPISALFESMSGFTATGLDMYAERVEGLPRSILFWRSLTQWVGGVGVIVLFLSVLVARSGTIAHKLYLAEGRDHRLVPSVVKTTRRIWAIYAGYTGLLILILIAIGMPVFDSINHSMTALATGGFSVNNNSIMAYDTLSFEIAIMPFMVIGGISFAMHYQLFLGNIKTFFKNIEVKAILVIIFISTVILAISLGLTFESFRYGSFQVITAITGTGFNTDAVGTYNDFQKFLLTILMIFGGGYGSTASAIKLIRVAIIFYALIWLIRKYLLPESVVHKMSIGNKYYSSEAIQNVAMYVLLYLILLVGGAMIFMYGGASGVNSLFEVASAQGNVGLSVGLTGPDMHLVEKITLIIVMWAGRLEIFPVLVLITAPFE